MAAERADLPSCDPPAPSPGLGRISGVGRRDRGFTLIEVVVALVIFALSFGILAQIIQTGFRHSSLAEASTIATLIARSQLARVGAELPLEVADLEGDTEEEFRWRTVIRLADQVIADDDPSLAVDDPAPESDDPAAEDFDEGPEDLALYQIEVTVAWGEPPAERSLTLTSLRLGPLPR